MHFVAFLNRQFVVFLFEYDSNSVVGNCQTYYRFYRQSVVTVLQLSVLPRILNTEIPSNDLSNTERYQCTNVIARKR